MKELRSGGMRGENTKERERMAYGPNTFTGIAMK